MFEDAGQRQEVVRCSLFVFRWTVRESGWGTVNGDRSTENVQQVRVGDDQLRRDVADDAGGKAGRTCRVQRYGKDAAQQAAEEHADPLGRVFTPQHHALAGIDAAQLQLSGKTSGDFCKLAIGGGIAAIAAMRDHGSLRRMLAKLLNER